MKRILSLLILISSFANAQNVYLVSGSSNFNINSAVYPLNSVILNVYKDSLNCELDLAAPFSSTSTSQFNRTIISNRAITKYYIDGVHVTTLAALRGFYNSYMVGGSGGGSTITSGTKTCAGDGSTTSFSVTIPAGKTLISCIIQSDSGIGDPVINGQLPYVINCVISGTTLSFLVGFVETVNGSTSPLLVSQTLVIRYSYF